MGYDIYVAAQYPYSKTETCCQSHLEPFHSQCLPTATGNKEKALIA
jgi:hypothetical protein